MFVTPSSRLKLGVVLAIAGSLLFTTVPMFGQADDARGDALSPIIPPGRSVPRKIDEPSAEPAAPFYVVPAPEWDAVFTRTSGWTGADGAYSVNLGDGRSLWLFSDTWLGPVEDGKHASGSTMVHNSIAVHPVSPDHPTAAPTDGEIGFYAGHDTVLDQQESWITPDPRPLRLTEPFNFGGEPYGWFWLGDGVVSPSPDGSPHLILFLWQIAKKSTDPGADEGVWNFKSVGNALALIDNCEEPITQWKVLQIPNPHCITVDAAAANAGMVETNWGAAAFYDPTPQANVIGGGYMYVYGVKETDPFNKQLVLARAPAAAVHWFHTWRFYNANAQGPWQWDPKLAGATSIADNIANELSVDKITIDGKEKFVMVHSEPVFGDSIMIRFADQLQGPWTDSLPVYDVPGIKKDKTYFTYAAKAHAHLSGDNELLISYVINSHDFGAMVNDAEIYRPRFIRVKNLNDLLRRAEPQTDEDPKGPAIPEPTPRPASGG